MRDTIDMAREAGLHIPYWGEEENPKKDPPRWTMVSPLPPLLKAFEALVRADEREVCAKECDELAGVLACHGDKDGSEICVSLRDTIRARGEIK